jgi:putative aldouronate transport system substrate-binding protein
MFRWGKRTLISSLILFAILSGCSQGSELVLKDHKTISSSELLDPKNPLPVSFDFYINYSWWLNNDWGKDLSSKEITKLTGVTLKISKPDNENDPLAKLNLMLSAGTLPDLIMMDESIMSKKLVQKKAVIPLDSLIEKYGPEIKKNIGIDYLSKYSVEEDGKIYSLPNGIFEEGQAPDSGTGVLILKQLYKDLGSPPLDTIDDLYKYLLKVKDSGKKNKNNEIIIPIFFDWPCNNLAGSYGLRFFSSYGGSYVYGQDGKLQQILSNPKMKQIFQFTSKLFQENLLDPDWLIEDNASAFIKTTSGRYAVYCPVNAYGWLDEANDKVKTESGDSYVLINTPLATGVTNPKYNLVNRKPWNRVYISTNCKQPVRAMEFFNWMASEKGQYISRIGPEGLIWQFGKDGNPIITDEYKKKLLIDKEQVLTDIGYMKWCMLQNNGFRPKATFALMTEEERAERIESGKIITNSYWYGPELEKISLDAASQVGIANTKLNSYFAKMDKQLYLAENSTVFEKYYKEIVNELKAIGVKEIEDELNKQIEENRK